MPDPGIILTYAGPVDHKKIDQLLRKLKKNDDFLSLQKTTSKRIYAILVECLENIVKHSASSTAGIEKLQPAVTITKLTDKIVIRSSNPVHAEKADSIARKLNQINRLSDKDLIFLYEDKINTKTRQGDNGAGLGFMLMKLKSGNRLDYRFITVDRFLSTFELKITVKKYIMRKLIIDQTSSSPKVVLDPDERYFEISGESRPPDVGEFYGEILNWLDDYSRYLTGSPESRGPVVFNFDLEYFNSSSAKYILDFCKQIATVRSKGKDVAVKWHYEGDDMDMLEVGREMSRMAKFPFEFVEKDIK